jgi:glycerol-3-phosphate dehydrogenase (NAD(P)+)
MRRLCNRRFVIRNVTVLGAGGWGTALAVHLARIGHDAHLWARDATLAADIQERRFNPIYLPEIRFPGNLRVTADLGEALRASDLVVAAVPSHGTREVLRRAAPHIRSGSTVVSATKGLERDTLFRMSEIVEQECGTGTRVVVLSGPSFAIELARELPTAVSIASRDPMVVERVQAEFRAPYFRLYGTDDVVGVEIGGALKNVIAIAAGVVEGLGLGHNALAGLITRGLAEMSRLGEAYGARPETFAGLAGMGDLIVTCYSPYGRNRHAGELIAQGATADEAIARIGQVIEGLTTAPVLRDLSHRLGIELPITEGVCRILDGDSLGDLVASLMGRRPRGE